MLLAAVSNNAYWCAAVGSRRDTHPTSTGVWISAGPPAPLFPDAITLRPGVPAGYLAGLIADRPTCSVKDSYADVDLEPYGFTTLFTAQWIFRPPAPDATASTRWSQVTEPCDLASWCEAAHLPETLPAQLLDDPDIRVLAAIHKGEVIGGAIANSSGPVVGVSNVFGDSGHTVAVWEELPSILAEVFPDRPMVGYERGAELDAALGTGFSAIGPLRVWLRSAESPKQDGS